jgi:hypothetical protein
MFYSRYSSNEPFIFLALLYLSITILISMSTFFIITKIEDTFHYQRVREIIYVLETANIAMVNDKNKLGLLWTNRCVNGATPVCDTP